MARKAGKTDTDATDTITIKKYANRRLYNTATSSYVTLDDLATMIQDGIDFTVHDAKTGEDITRAVLTQIIVEQEARGNHLLPAGFLKQLISFYGDNLQGVVPQYLDMTMQSFARNQEQMRTYIENAFGGMHPFSSFENVGRKNMAMFEQAMSMMSPFNSQDQDEPQQASAAEPTAEAAAPDEALDKMKAQLEEMQMQLDLLSKKQKH